MFDTVHLAKPPELLLFRAHPLSRGSRQHWTIASSMACQSALEIDNIDAIELLQSGLYTESLSVLRRILGVLRDLLEREDDICYDDFPRQALSDRPGRSFETVRISSDNQEDCSSSEHFALDTVPSNPYQIFDRAFLLPQAEDTEDEWTCSCEALAITFYNMGLAYHFHSIRNAGSQRLASTALRLYMLASSTLSRLCELTEAFPARHVVLWLALFNNISHIQALQFNREEVHVYRKKIVTLLTTVTDDHIVDGYLLEDDHAFFEVDMLRCEESLITTHASAA